MKKLCIYLAVLTSILIILGSCATNKMEYISKDYEIFGTWINSEYEKSADAYRAKMIYQPNGEYTFYNLISDSSPATEGEFVITNKWIDSDGIVWYTFLLSAHYTETWSKLLAKISNSGKTLELSLGPSDYPKDMDPDNLVVTPFYQIYDRQ